MFINSFQTNLKRVCNEIYRNIGGTGPEKIYQNALCFELNQLYKNEYDIYKEEVIPLFYKDKKVSVNRLDLSLYPKIDGDINVPPAVILELKWTYQSKLDPWQLSNYMKLKNCKYGFLINFEKLGSYPTNFCAQVYDIETNEKITYPVPDQKYGSVKILRFESLKV